jgi:hypothetical protein
VPPADLRKSSHVSSAILSSAGGDEDAWPGWAMITSEQEAIQTLQKRRGRVSFYGSRAGIRRWARGCVCRHDIGYGDADSEREYGRAVVSNMILGLGVWLVVTGIRYTYRQHTTKHCQQQMQDSADGSRVFVTASRRCCIFPTMNPSLRHSLSRPEHPCAVSRLKRQSPLSRLSHAECWSPLPLPCHVANVETRQRSIHYL